MTAWERYRTALAKIPAPGCGCHTALLSVANHGVMAKHDPQQLHDDIRQAIPPGARHIPDKEIADAIRKALVDFHAGAFTPRPKPQPVVEDGKAALNRILQQATITTEVDLWESSPIRLLGLPQDDTILLLETLYTSNDLLFIGEQHDSGILGETIRPVAEWLAYFRAGGHTAPHIIPNPITGQSAPKKTGDGDTFRGDGNVAAFRFCVVEFDNLPREDQLKFWSVIKLPIVALIDSGGKSIHGWVDLGAMGGVATAAEWMMDVKGRLYDRLLIPLGVDRACSNPARLSRLPGHYRADKGAYQRLLWLRAEGKAL